MLQMAILTAAIHTAYLFSVVFGAIWTRRRPFWTTVHVLALVWGIIVEVGPWPCPLTMAEEYFTARSPYAAYEHSHLLHFLDGIIYPDLPGPVVVTAGVAICAINLAVYGWRLWKVLTSRRALQRGDRLQA